MTFLPLDGPHFYDTLSVTTSATEVKVGASIADERKVVTVQPIDGVVYYGFDNSVTTSTGTKIYKGQYLPLEIGIKEVWLITATGTVDVRITEMT